MAQLQGVIDDIRLFGRWPKRGAKASDAEKLLAKRLSYVLEAMPEGVRTELQALGPEPDEVFTAIKSLGRMPVELKSPTKGSQESESLLAQRLRVCRKGNKFTQQQLAELEELEKTPKDTAFDSAFAAVKLLGHLPREFNSPKNAAHRAEVALYFKLHVGRKRSMFSQQQLAELEELERTTQHPLDAARSAKLLDAASVPPDPMAGFADEAENLLEQDLMLLSSNQSTKALQRRMKPFTDFINDPSTANTEFANRYKERMLAAAAAQPGPSAYVPGDDICGDELRKFSDSPIMTGPLVCQICRKDFVDEKSFTQHKKHEHSGENECRKRVLFLMEEQGCRPITAQEKRLMVHNFAHFQQFCHPGAKGNYFADTKEVPRCEAACAICTKKDWLEHRHKLHLFSEPPANIVSENADAKREAAEDSDGEEGSNAKTLSVASLLKHEGIYYLRSPEKVNALLDVSRYAGRWPLIPTEELHASSVQHPDHPEWRWLLHSRRVPVLDDSLTEALRASDASQPVDTLPTCAGIGDPAVPVWACWECLTDLGAVKPKMPRDACANDNWIGREKIHVRDSSRATKMLASLGRCCWKQIRLGKGEANVQQKGVTGNTIFFSQPTADIPSMELPPPTNALVDSLSIIFTRSTQDLSKAWWATVERDNYMRIVRERKAQCPAFANAVIREDEAQSRLPAEGVPEHITACAQHVEGAENAPVRLSGPASRAPDVGRHEEAGDESESAAEDKDADAEEADDKDAQTCDQDVSHEALESVAECTVALDPLHDIVPVRMMQALQGTLEALQTQAARIAKHETTPTVADSDGILQAVGDEGGRHELKSLVLDVQRVASTFDEKTLATLEAAQSGAESCRMVTSESLAVPTGKPLDAFDGRTWAASYVELWYGDGAPNLKRERPMLFEQVARRLINMEELEYSLPTDESPYTASSQSRFNTPEIVAVLGDVIRRLRMLKGTKVAIGRKGFTADLKALASATEEDFMIAMGIVGPRESITSACARPDMPPKVKTAMKTLLLSMSDVPGTEGRKTQLRFNGHGNNLMFGASSYFVTPNFADTYSPLVKLLHEGPGKTSHLNITSDTMLDADITRAAPRMPSLHQMHQIVAADPRAQAKFGLLMMELHYRYIQGIERLHVGRVILARPFVPVQDEIASPQA